MQHLVSKDDFEPRQLKGGGLTAYDIYGDKHGLQSLSVILIEVQPGRGAPLHRHPYEEVFVIHEGQARYTVGETSVDAGAGDVILVPASAWHAFTNVGAGLLRQSAVHASPKLVIEFP